MYSDINVSTYFRVYSALEPCPVMEKNFRPRIVACKDIVDAMKLRLRQRKGHLGAVLHHVPLEDLDLRVVKSVRVLVDRRAAVHIQPSTHHQLPLGFKEHRLAGQNPHLWLTRGSPPRQGSTSDV